MADAIAEQSKADLGKGSKVFRADAKKSDAADKLSKARDALKVRRNTLDNTRTNQLS